MTVTPSDITITGSVTQCSGTTATPVPATLTATSCTLPQCNHATCVERSLIQQFAPDIDQAALALLGTCGSADVFCIPNDFIATTGKFQTKTCVSLENAEGRCISTCVPQVKTQITTLPQADCLPDEKCAPCWNPIDGVTTGACDQGCDTGPTQPKVVFTECGSGAGVCVPKTLVSDPVQLKALEGVDDPTGICADTTRVCAPKLKAADQSAPFATCTMTSAAALLATMRNAAGQLAACVPKYIVPVGQQPLLLQDGCQANELCAPCYNPLPDAAGLVNQPTGACAHP